ncbi:MAG: NAD(P)H-dependent flavin oxidoreductase [Cyclobacteriaceae bacterium]
MKNRITELFRIKFPIIQAGMVWCSGWKLASAVSEAGGLGIIGSGSMYPEILREHIRKCQVATNKPFGVNVPLLYPDIDKLIEIIIEEKVKIVFTSAGNPAIWTKILQNADIKVVHVVSNVKFARKCEDVGVDAIVAEGFEAGGHNGREETTTFCLLPLVRKAVSLPLIAAGGIGDGTSMLGAMALGAEAVQIGSRFAASKESSAHENFKKRIVEAGEGDTELVMKQLTPVRLLKNEFYQQIKSAELSGVQKEELRILLGKGRSKKGMFEGDMDEGELEIGQISAGIDRIMPAADIVREIWTNYTALRKKFAEESYL